MEKEKRKNKRTLSSFLSRMFDKKYMQPVFSANNIKWDSPDNNPKAVYYNDDITSQTNLGP